MVENNFVGRKIIFSFEIYFRWSRNILLRNISEMVRFDLSRRRWPPSDGYRHRPISSVTSHHVTLRTEGQLNVNKSLDFHHALRSKRAIRQSILISHASYSLSPPCCKQTEACPPVGNVKWCHVTLEMGIYIRFPLSRPTGNFSTDKKILDRQKILDGALAY